METETTTEMLPAIVPPEEARNLSAPRKWGVAADVVAKATEGLPERERDLIRWLDAYGRDSKRGMRDIATQLTKDNGEPYSYDQMYAVLTGRRAVAGNNLEPYCAAIERFKRMVCETDARLSTAFVETSLTQHLHRIFRRAFEAHRLAFVFGESQIGKTAAAAEYARRHNHGETIMIRMPTGGALVTLSDEMCLRFGIGRNNFAFGRRRVMDAITDRNLIIVDECHHALQTRGGITRSLEWLREIHDRRGCGMVLIGTYAFKGALETNSVLRQLWRRRSPGLVVQLPEVPAPADVVRFAAAFGLPPAPDDTLKVKYPGVNLETGETEVRTFSANPARLQAETLRHQGLGSWIKLLEDSQASAKADGKSITWGRVLATYCLAEAMEKFA
jgi:DNA transposition AAA+ family ATPase